MHVIYKWRKTNCQLGVRISACFGFTWHFCQLSSQYWNIYWECPACRDPELPDLNAVKWKMFWFSTTLAHSQIDSWKTILFEAAVEYRKVNLQKKVTKKKRKKRKKKKRKVTDSVESPPLTFGLCISALIRTVASQLWSMTFTCSSDLINFLSCACSQRWTMEALEFNNTTTNL